MADVACSGLEPMVHNKACGLNNIYVQYRVQLIQKVYFLHSMSHCKRRVPSIQGEQNIPCRGSTTSTYSIFDILLNRDDNVRMGVSGDGRAPVTPHARSMKFDSFTHFRNCNQFFGLKILHPYFICTFWSKFIL